MLHACTLLVRVLLAVFALSLPARAGVREAAPEDGILCCTSVEPFLFQGNEVLGITGRAGIFKSESRGAVWRRSMEGQKALIPCKNWCRQ